MDSAKKLLEAAYDELDFSEGQLYNATAQPVNINMEEWIEKGDWLSLAQKVSAEKIFFVNNNPVIIFAESQVDDAEILRETYNRIWCMARPLLLFLARPGELSVYDLTEPPARTTDEWEKRKPLDIAKSAAEVATKLHAYHREQIESGRLFEDNRFGKPKQRADQSLINDLKIVRDRLKDEEGLDGKYAHALIGRSIFIRYLEDRKILTRDYFMKVVSQNTKWEKLLDTPPSGKPDINTEMENLLYPRVLSDKKFSYALFKQLARDFNGDMFPSDDEEEKAVSPRHLELLQGFLRGDVDIQSKLFFWAYRFEIIPIELISSIYEEFYHVTHGESDSKGTHYTPPTLVEYVLSKTLTPDRLETNPRILDAACGSGIFLVEAFRRIVRYRTRKQNRRLNSKELRKILREQIAGIELTEEAVRVAAFSLYLALLHYQEPPDILQQIEHGKRLPNLKYQKGTPTDEFHFNSLLEANAFDIESKIANEDKDVLLGFSNECADIVIGNPPWGAPDKDDADARASLNIALKWCDQRDKSVGDKERSQAFIWRALDLLRPGGCAGLLISTGIFFKGHKKSQEFRQKWLDSVTLSEVVNFAHVRKIFFKGAIAPFASVIFKKEPSNNKNLVHYWSAKETASVKQSKALILSRSDLHLVPQEKLRNNDNLWKIYWWGSHRDEALISALEINSRLSELVDSQNTPKVIAHRGFTEGKKGKKPSDWLLKYKEFPQKYLERYGQFDKEKLLPAPKEVKDKGVKEVYYGKRLLVKKGPTKTGQIIARLVSESFCFRHSVYGIKLRDAKEWEYKILLGILWSSLPSYYFFLTTSKWGMWHYDIQLEEFKKLPVRYPGDTPLSNRIIKIVEQLSANGNEINKLEYELDEAIFDLYELSLPERDLIRDMCETGLDFLYNGTKSIATDPVFDKLPFLKQGIIKSIPSSRDKQSRLEGYLYAFLQIWNRELESEGEFNWRVICSEAKSPMLAVVFSTQQKDVALHRVSGSDIDEWAKVLNRLQNDLLIPYESNRVYIDGMIRAVTDTDIIIIKRNESRLWTRSMAREDAEATLLQAINLQEAKQSTHK